MGDTRSPQDGPDRMPVADPALHRPRSRDHLRPHRRGPGHRRTRGWLQLRHPQRHLRPPGRHVHVRGAHRGPRAPHRPRPDPAGSDRPRRRHRQRARHRPGRPRTPGDRPRWARRRGRRLPPTRPGHLRLRRALRLVRPRGRSARMTGPHLGYEDLRADTVRQVAKLMAGAAITAPKSGGVLFLAGKHNFMETVIIDDKATLSELAAWMRARGAERRESIWFRDADMAEAIDAVLLVGIADWYPPNYDCGACGYATCAEFLHATKQLRDDSAELEFAGTTFNLRAVAVGIALAHGESRAGNQS